MTSLVMLMYAGNDTSQLMSNITSFDYDKARASGVDVVGKTR